MECAPKIAAVSLASNPKLFLKNSAKPRELEFGDGSTRSGPPYPESLSQVGRPNTVIV